MNEQKKQSILDRVKRAIAGEPKVVYKPLGYVVIREATTIISIFELKAETPTYYFTDLEGYFIQKDSGSFIFPTYEAAVAHARDQAYQFFGESNHVIPVTFKGEFLEIEPKYRRVDMHVGSGPLQASDESKNGFVSGANQQNLTNESETVVASVADVEADNHRRSLERSSSLSDEVFAEVISDVPERAEPMHNEGSASAWGA